jgi:hypothetical protein
VSEFDDIVNGAFSSLAQTPAAQILSNSYAAHALRNALGLARVPGDVAQPMTTAKPNVMSEEDAFRLNQADTHYQDQAHAGAINLLGYGAQFAQPGALGMAGGFHPAHHASAMADISAGKTLLSGIKNALGEPLPSLSEKSIKQALEENPGASIMDVAGLGPSEPKPPMSAEDKYKGYSVLKYIGHDDKYNVYDPGGGNIGTIKKMEEGQEGYDPKNPWALDLHSDEEGMAGVTHSSVSDALEEAASAHPKLSSNLGSTEGMGKHIEPFDWNALRGEQGVDLPGHALEQGYNALYPLYKGTKDVHDYPEKLGTTLLSGKKQWEKGLFFADEPRIAKSYGNPLTYVARAEKPMQVDWQKATGETEYDTTYMHHLIEAARAKGADLLHIRNIEDIGKYDAPQNQIVALDPSVVRAPGAKFDPARMKENVVKAGIAALGATPLFFNKDGSLLIHLGDRGQGEEDDKK